MQIGILAKTKKEGKQILDELSTFENVFLKAKSTDGMMTDEDYYKVITPKTMRGLKFDQIVATSDFRDLKDSLSNGTPISKEFTDIYLLLFDSEIPDEFKVIIWGD